MHYLPLNFLNLNNMKIYKSLIINMLVILGITISFYACNQPKILDPVAEKGRIDSLFTAQSTNVIDSLDILCTNRKQNMIQ